jgi:sarcosine oxidase subunit beta
MNYEYDIVLIGGGAVGLSSAYHLARRGAGRVLVLERNRLGEGSTGKCAGGIRLQFATAVNIQFSLDSLKVFENFHDQFGRDIAFRQSGYVYLASTDEEMAQLEKSCALQAELGVPVRLLSAREIGERWPFLNTADVAGGSLCERDGYAGPYEVMEGYISACRSLGVDLAENEEALGIETAGGSVKGIVTSRRFIKAPLVVNAAGAWGRSVGAMAGVEVPVEPFRRQVFSTAPFDGVPDALPLIVDHHRAWYFRREGAGLLLAGAQDRRSSFDSHTDYEGMCFAAENAVHRVPSFSECRIQGGWAGSYEITPDCHGIIGAAEAPQGFYIACGFSGHGFMHSPAAGRTLAELVLHGRSTDIDITPLSLRRFREGKLNFEPMTAFRRD